MKLPAKLASILADRGETPSAARIPLHNNVARLIYTTSPNLGLFLSSVSIGLRPLPPPELSPTIQWLPHGRSWRMLNRDLFAEHALPRYFGHTNYSSFVRIVNAW